MVLILFVTAKMNSMRTNADVALIIPVYNEAQVIKSVVNNALKYIPFVVCVDDGSRDKSSEKISQTNALLVKHPINLGQGAALQTGIEYSLQFPHIKYFVTFDADGQHDIHDVVTMLEVIEKERLDIVLGSRFLGMVKNISGGNRAMLKLAIRFTNVFSGVKLTDTHNGLRVFNRDFANKINISMPDMAHASEIIDKMGKGTWKYKEVPITISYSDYSRAKGQSMVNSVNILFDLFLSKAGRK